jgi:hypothetical protein
MTQLEQRQLGGSGLRIAQIAGLTPIAHTLQNKQPRTDAVSDLFSEFKYDSA